MEDIYYSLNNPAAYSGINALAKASQKPRSSAKRFLDKQPTYRKFRIPIRKQKRARIVVGSLGVQFQGDLFDLSKFSKFNSNYRWVLLIVDSFSRLVKCQALKNKTAEEVAKGMDKIFSEYKTEGKLAPLATYSTDLGNEFFNKVAAVTYKKFNISQIPLRHPIKAGLAEISGRYILEKLYKHMYHKQTKRWVDALPDVVEAKNKRTNRKTNNLAPVDINFDNQAAVFASLYPKGAKPGKYSLNMGDRVQILVDKLPFAKSFAGYYSEKIFRIIKRHPYTAPRYTIVDEEDDEEIAGTYYDFELYRI